MLVKERNVAHTAVCKYPEAMQALSVVASLQLSCQWSSLDI